MDGAPKPTTAPIIAKIRCERAFCDPVKNEKAANTNPKIPTSGKTVLMSFDCTAIKLDSTLADAIIGVRNIHNEPTRAAPYFLIFIKPLFDLKDLEWTFLEAGIYWGRHRPLITRIDRHIDLLLWKAQIDFQIFPQIAAQNCVADRILKMHARLGLDFFCEDRELI